MESRRVPATTPPTFATFQQKRRDEALEVQRNARQRQLFLARQAVVPQDGGSSATSQSTPATTTPSGAAGTAEQPIVLRPPASAELPPSSPSQSDTVSTDHAMDHVIQRDGQQQQQQQQHKPRRRRGKGSSGAAQGSGKDTSSMDLDHTFPAASSKAHHVTKAGGRAGSPQEHPRHYWARQLQQPEWMTDIPPDLATQWLVMPRPEGPRVVVTTTRQHTVIRSKGGSVLFTGLSGLPEGSPRQSGPAREHSVLEGVWCEETRTLYISDVLVWRGYALNDCTAEFRVYWLQSKLKEERDLLPLMTQPPNWSNHPATTPATMDADQLQDNSSSAVDAAMATLGGGGQGAAATDAEMSEAGQEMSESSAASGVPPVREWIRVLPLPVVAADVAGLQQAYQGAILLTQSLGVVDEGFVQDGLYLLHREGHYSSGGSTPLALCYKDAHCSRWPLDTGPQGEPLEHQVITLEYRMDCTVATADQPPAVLGTMPLTWVQAMGPVLRAGRLLKFSIRKGGILWAPDGRPAGADLHYEGPANQRRGKADVFSKILFQHMARTAPITWEMILSAATAHGPQQNGSMAEHG